MILLHLSGIHVQNQYAVKIDARRVSWEEWKKVHTTQSKDLRNLPEPFFVLAIRTISSTRLSP
jgi:hypothetical protein